MDWPELEAACAACLKCPLGEKRTNPVFGVGARDAEVMLIGEGPGEHEDLQGEPFVGKAGQLLDEMLSLVGLSREKNVYIANIVKCRPPKNRDPLPDEQDACMPWLMEQIGLVRPKIIVCMGRIAAMRLIRPDFKITQDHGRWTDQDGVAYTAIFHPAALLRDESRMPDTFADLKSIQRKIRERCTHTVLLDPITGM